LNLDMIVAYMEEYADFDDPIPILEILDLTVEDCREQAWPNPPEIIQALRSIVWPPTSLSANAAPETVPATGTGSSLHNLLRKYDLEALIELEIKESLTFNATELIDITEDDCILFFEGSPNVSKIFANLQKLVTYLKASQAIHSISTETSLPPLPESQPLPLPSNPLDRGQDFYSQLEALRLNDVIDWLKSNSDVKASDLFEFSLSDCEDIFEEHETGRGKEIYEHLKTIKEVRPASQSTLLAKAAAVGPVQSPSTSDSYLKEVVALKPVSAMSREEIIAELTLQMVKLSPAQLREIALSLVDEL